jgi:hypothetical protein
MEGGWKKVMIDQETIKRLKEREQVIIEELEFSPLRSLENELYEIRDTLSKLENKEPLIYNEYGAYNVDDSPNVIKYGSE